MHWTLKNLSSTAQKGEQQALSFLKKQGLQLICRNYACKSGEIDLVMLDGMHTVFIEVRYRKNNRFGGALASITPAKCQRIRQTAQHYLQHKKLNSACRFDVVAIEGNSQPHKITWIQDAF